MNAKPGWRTSEFWTTLFSQGLALLTALGLVTGQDAGTLQGALGQCVAAVFLLLANGWVVVRYIQARVLVKTGKAEAGPSTFPRVLPFLLAAVALGAVGHPVQAQLPWRRQVEQRLQELHNQIRDLRQQAPTPQAPAPHLILLQPYQTLPIAGEPRQQLPVPGEPRQQLPVPGEPRQQLPLPGEPKQPLPVPGPPQQQLPIPGPGQQPLPVQPPRAGRSQPYTVIRALYRR